MSADGYSILGFLDKQIEDLKLLKKVSSTKRTFMSMAKKEADRKLISNSIQIDVRNLVNPYLE
jgi:hypothetical protein